MTARRVSSDGPGVASFGGRALLVGAVAFAAAATGLLVLTDEQKWLRLGIVAALWAALTGAFLAARYRRQLGEQRESADERQEIYELELEREIAARREFELEVEAKAKRKAEESSRDDIAALRTELQNMRQTLESLLGGEFLVERYALHEATRMRSVPEDRSLARRDVKHLPAAAAVPQVVREAETEMIERVREVHQIPRRPEPRVDDSRPPSVPRRPQRPDRPVPEQVQPVPRQQQPSGRQPLPQLPPPRVEHPSEVSDRWFVPEGLADQQPRAEQPRRPEPPRPPEPSRRPEPRRPEPHHPEPHHPEPRHPEPRHPEPSRQAEPTQRRPAPAWETAEQQRAQSRDKRQEQPRRPEPAVASEADQTSWLARYNQPQDGEPTYSTRAYVPPVRPEPQPTPAPPPETGGGRRRRAEGQPSWQETVGRRAEEPSGSHASGRSVSELLANHGHDSNPRRRRRRED